ncbi:carboxymuconolactone decarboxylase family protein [Streptomyces hygroscopicus]|uniref:carboxymuconolactone decarboxylase family protein n=1 Tax=Streptomyces hygroscopicus TaxID=1912 RepID=UPI0006910BF0|nr:carboxymuconolactone decarboxylase family protein [Streptomyces hygroscopicus]
MARIRYPELSEDEETVVNIVRMLRHSPDIGSLVNRLAAAQFAAGALPAVDRELVIMNSGVAFSAPYEWEQHIPISRSVGVTDAQRDALAARDLTSGEFTEVQRTLLAFADSAARSAEVSDEIFEAARGHYTDRQLVETVILVGFYFLIARMSTIFQLEIDPPGDSSALNTIVDTYKTSQ